MNRTQEIRSNHLSRCSIKTVEKMEDLAIKKEREYRFLGDLMAHALEKLEIELDTKTRIATSQEFLYRDSKRATCKGCIHIEYCDWFYECMPCKLCRGKQEGKCIDGQKCNMKINDEEWKKFRDK